MVKTTVCLGADLAATIKQLAAREGRTPAELIRDALADYVRQHGRPAIPGVGEFRSLETGSSLRTEEILRAASRGGKWRRQRS